MRIPNLLPEQTCFSSFLSSLGDLLLSLQQFYIQATSLRPLELLLIVYLEFHKRTISISLAFLDIFVYLPCIFSSLLENGTAKRHKRIVHWRTWFWSYSSSEDLHLSPVKLVRGSQATGNVIYRCE